MSKSNKFSPEVRERAVRMVLEHQGEYESQWAAIVSIAAQDRLHGRDAARLGAPVRARQGLAARPDERRAGAHQGARARGARAAPGQRDPAQGVGVFCPGGARPPLQAMKAFIDAHRDVHGVEPICRVLPIAPSTYYAHAARKADPELRSQRAQTRRRSWCPRSSACGRRTSQVYGVRKVWRQLRRERYRVARCTVQRLMKRLGLKGVIRGQGRARRRSATQGAVPADQVQRQFRADTAERTVGGGLHLRLDLAGLRLRGLRDRRVRPPDRGLAGPRRRGRTSFSTRWSRRCTARRPIGRIDSCITAIAACSTYRSATPSGWPRPASSPRWAAWATSTTTRWPRRSTGCTRPR